MIVVSDTSVISALIQIHRIELLREIFGTVIIPQAVSFELTLHGVSQEDFAAAWLHRLTYYQAETPIYYLGKQDLILAKQTAARPQDLADLDELRRSPTLPEN